MPMGQYSSWDDCIARVPSHVTDKEAYCGAIKHEVEDKMKKTRRPSLGKVAEVILDLKRIQKEFCK